MTTGPPPARPPVSAPAGRPPAIPTARLRLPRRPRGPGAVVSMLIHGTLIVLLVVQGTALLDSGGGGAGPRGGGGGERGVRFFTLPAPPAIAAMELPPAPTVVPPAISLPEPAALHLERLELAPPVGPAAGGGGPGTGGGEGSGAGGGIGSSQGPGTGGDERYIVPTPRGVIVPPENPPRSVRGRQYRVRFWVSADGRVDRVAVEPEIPDEKYRRDFRERMLNYRFYPARTRDGQPVASVIAISITP